MPDCPKGSWPRAWGLLTKPFLGGNGVTWLSVPTRLKSSWCCSMLPLTNFFQDRTRPLRLKRGSVRDRRRSKVTLPRILVQGDRLKVYLGVLCPLRGCLGIKSGGVGKMLEYVAMNRPGIVGNPLKRSHKGIVKAVPGFRVGDAPFL